MKLTKYTFIAVIMGCFFSWSPVFALQSDNFTYTAENNTVTITGFTGSGGAVVIPDSIGGMPVVSIGDSAFDGCTVLLSVSIPDSVTSIGERAFRACYSLTSLTIPDSVTSIGFEAFESCYTLNSLTIGSSVASIGNAAFLDCRGLTSATIPASVTSIGDYAFYGCSKLTGAYFLGNAPEMGEYVFANCAKKFKVHYIAGSEGFKMPWWHGYPARSDKCPAQKALGVDNPKLEHLRAFRDNILAKTAVGRKAIEMYYNNADGINEALDRSPVLSAFTRCVLEMIAPMWGRQDRFLEQ